MTLSTTALSYPGGPPKPVLQPVVAAPSLCATANPAYARANFEPQAQYKIKNRKTRVASFPDMLAGGYLKVIGALRPVAVAPLPTKNFPNIAYREQGATTGWWAILCLNGFAHPLAVKYGTPCLSPNAAPVLSAAGNSSLYGLGGAFGSGGEAVVIGTGGTAGMSVAS